MSARVATNTPCFLLQKSSESVSFLELGAQFIYPFAHSNIYKSCKMLNISFKPLGFGFSQNPSGHCYCSLKSENVIMMDSLLQKVESDPQFKAVLKIIDRDLSLLSFNDCFNQIDILELDVPLQEYFTNRLKFNTESVIEDYFYLIAYFLNGSDPALQSAIQFLYTLKGCCISMNNTNVGEVLHALMTDINPRNKKEPVVGNITSKSCDTEKNLFEVDSCKAVVEGGMSEFVRRLCEEFLALGGTVELNMPVIVVTRETTAIERVPNVPNYDYPTAANKFIFKGDNSDDNTSVLTYGFAVNVRTQSGHEYVARSVIMALPLNCLRTIRFNPPLSHTVKVATERCPANSQFVKLYVAVEESTVSLEVNRLITHQDHCKEIYAVRPVDALGGNKVSKELDAKKVGFLSVSGRKSDFTSLEDLQRNLRRIYPNLRTVDIQFTSDAVAEETNSIAAASIEITSDEVISPAIFSRSFYPPTSSLDMSDSSHTTSTMNSSENHSLFNDNYLSESDEYRGFSGHCCHEDFVSSPWCRGSWFCLRSGTAKLHAAAQVDAVQLAEWNHISGKEHTPLKGKKGGVAAVIKSGQDNSTQTVQDDVEKLCLLSLACGELSPQWPGWLEGACVSGMQAADRVIPHLVPKKVEKNFAKFLGRRK